MRAYQRYINRLKDTASQLAQELKNEIYWLNKKIIKLSDDKDRLLDKTRMQARQIDEMRIQILNLEHQNGLLKNKVRDLESPLPW